MSRRYAMCVIALAALAMTLAGCTLNMPRDLGRYLPREWRETFYGPDATPTPRLLNIPTSTPPPKIGTPVPAPVPTRLPTLTRAPTRTATVTHTATPTPERETLTLQQGATWYIKGQFVPYEGMEDTYISDWNRNANFADAPSLSVRQGNVMAALLYIRLRDLPPTLPVIRAELSLYVSARSNDTPMTITLRPITRFWSLRETTWLQAANNALWQKPGAQGEEDRGEQPVGEATATSPGVWLTFDLTDLVKTWLRAPEANEGVLITGDAANAVQYDITSADARDQQHRPRLTLTLPTGAIALGPPKSPPPTVAATATADPTRPQLVDVLRLLPLGSMLLARAEGDLDGDGILEIVSAYRTPQAQGLRLAVFNYPGIAGQASDYRLYWSSAELSGAAPVRLDIADITGDSIPEILLDVSSPRGSGQMLFVCVRQPLQYRMATPVGGYFDDKDYFGESGYELADVNNDGRVEIRAYHGNQADIYVWDGVAFTVVK